MSLTITQNFFYAHPVADVWEHLTNPELMAQWLMPNDFQPVLGQDFQFRMKPLPQKGLDGIFQCKVLEIVPQKKLSYSWKAGPGNGEVTLDTVVIWTLTPKDNGTELHLEHSGFKEKENQGLYEGMTAGWLEKLQKIAVLIDTVPHDSARS